MSEEKLYAVKNDEGKWANVGYYFGTCAWATPDKDEREKYVKHHGGHVVTLVEEPEKVVLSEKQAKIVEGANKSQFPASYISDHTGSSYCLEKLLMDAYANGYTMEKEKKYNIKVPLVQAQGGLWFYINSDDKLDATYLQELAKKFTMDEIEHYGLQDCEKVWCDSDD